MKCKLCNAEDVVLFHEHYEFCKECSAIYTSMILQETNCKHITEPVICVEREPWYKNVRENSIYIFQDRCSVCGKLTIADGW